MRYPLLRLKPTQFAVGMRQVRKKAAWLADLGKGKLRDYLRKRPVPVVLSLEKELFIVDRHHLARVCWELKLDEVYVEQRADLSHLSREEFWTALLHSRWIYLYDRLGRGPLDPAGLPRDIRGLADDPYRSLAWELRLQNAFSKSKQPYAEFAWAQFLRTRLSIGPGEEGFDAAVEEALALARSPDAKGLPGARVRAAGRSRLRKLLRYFL